jgi:membrane protease subunit HflC
MLEWDAFASEMPTKDNKYIYIDAFARWRISDPLQFYKNAKTERNAQSLLDDIIDGAIRDEISNRSMTEIVRYSDIELAKEEEDLDNISNFQIEDINSNTSGARLKIIESIKINVSEKLFNQNMGIDLIDIQLKRINYNKEVQEKLFHRMISGQNRIAEKYRAQGQGKKQEILGNQIQKKKEILSNAYLRSQKIKGEADAEVTKIFADTYGKSPEFYRFIKSLETYNNTIDSTSLIILSTDNVYLKYINK